MDNNETRYERNPAFIFRKVVDETVLVPIHNDVADMDCIYALNPVGASIWQALDQPLSQQDLHALLHKEYDVDPEVLMADLARFLTEMASIGALREV